MNKILSTVALLAISGNVLMAGGDIAPVKPVVPDVIASDSWEYSASVYMWIAGMGGETANGEEIDVDFSDILDNLEFTFMGTFGAQKGKWGLLADIIYMDLESDVNTPGGHLTNVEMKSWIITPAVTYRVMESDGANLDILAGARYLYMKTSLEFDTPASLSVSDGVWNGIVGVRGKYDINEKWYMQGHLDVGTGDTDMTWQAFAGVGYKYESFDLVAGYRYLEWSFDDGDTGGGVYNELTVNGPIIGARFYF